MLKMAARNFCPGYIVLQLQILNDSIGIKIHQILAKSSFAAMLLPSCFLSVNVLNMDYIQTFAVIVEN